MFWSRDKIFNIVYVAFVLVVVLIVIFMAMAISGYYIT